MQRTALTRRGVAACAGLLGVAWLGLSPVSSATAAAADPYESRIGHVQLTSDALTGLGSATDSGQISGGEQLTVGVMLSRPDAAGENAYLADVYNPASGNFRQFLSPQGWQARFGVAQSRFDALGRWLQGGGLSITPVAGSTEYLLASGPASNVEALFQVHIDTYAFKGISFYANTTAPTVPADLGVLDVAGLQNYAHMRSLKQIHEAAVASGAVPAHVAGPQVPPGANQGSTSPQDLWSIYDQPSNNQGQGESMAIFGDGCAEPTDNAACAQVDLIGNLRRFEKSFNLPQMPILISHYGTASEPITDTSGTGEFDLDLPASTGMAPLADFEHLYFGNNGGDPDEIAAITAWNRDDNGPRQGSWSYAGCEATPVTGSQPGGPGNPPQGTGGEVIGNPNQDGYEAALKEAVELGRTLFNSAGDLGANGCPSNANTALNGVTPAVTPINNYPSSSSWVTTVGGTVLYWNGDGATGATPATRAFEYSWTYSGGGTSLYVSAPAWQQAQSFHTNSDSAPGVTYPCSTDWETPPNPYAPGTFCRGLPDVAAQSGDVLTNGYAAGGGTSLSSPLWLGMWTRIQAASSNPGRVGFAAAAIYANNADATKYARDFFDVGGAVQGYNPGAPTGATAPVCSENGIPGYNCSGSGWDFLSGWGTPDVTNLMKDLDHGNTTPVAFTPPANAPETPAAALLIVAALGAVGVVGVVRRRRVAGAAD